MSDSGGARGSHSPARPGGDVYDWYTRGLALLDAGNAGAAAQLLEHAFAEAPESASVREALARALYDSRRYDEAAEFFRRQTAHNPDDDYAQFGLGLALRRLGRFELAAEHLALAAVMRPQRADYVRALQEVRATLRLRDTGR